MVTAGSECCKLPLKHEKKKRQKNMCEKMFLIYSWLAAAGSSSSSVSLTRDVHACLASSHTPTVSRENVANILRWGNKKKSTYRIFQTCLFWIVTSFPYICKLLFPRWVCEKKIHWICEISYMVFEVSVSDNKICFNIYKNPNVETEYKANKPKQVRSFHEVIWCSQ